MILYRFVLTFVAALVFLTGQIGEWLAPAADVLPEHTQTAQVSVQVNTAQTEEQETQSGIQNMPRANVIVEGTLVTPGAVVDTSPSETPPSPAVLEALTAEFFDDAVFIGDSISHTLQTFCIDHDALGTAIFLCRGSYSLRSAVDSSLQTLNYGDYSGAPEDILPHLKANKVYIMLGMNDISTLEVQDYYSYWETMVGNIRNACPKIEIIFQSCTPIFHGQDDKPLNNNEISRYNAMLRGFALEHGCNFIDIGALFMNENGELAPQYCKDQYAHLTDDCAEIWVQALKDRKLYAYDPLTGQYGNYGS